MQEFVWENDFIPFCQVQRMNAVNISQPAAKMSLNTEAGRMKICLLGNAASIHIQRWAAYFVQKGYELHIISLSPGAVEGAKVHRVSWWPPVKQIGYLAALPRIRLLVRQISPDVLHAHYAVSYGVLGALAGFRPLVIGAWGSDILVIPGSSKVRWAVLLHALFRADLITSLADHITRVLVERGVPPCKIKTIPFGVDTQLFCPLSNSVRSFDIICTRNFETVYDVGTFLRALPAIIARYPNFTCLLLGDGPLRDSLKRLAAELGVEDNLTWLGWLPPQELAQWLRQTKVYVSASLSDGTSTALTEAMASGCFPVVSDIEANRPWIEHGSSGFLFPPADPGALADCVLEALKSAPLRESALIVNRRKVERDANWHTIMGSVEELYQRLVTEYKQLLLGKVPPAKRASNVNDHQGDSLLF
jgi:glycosyltransferase involved in cell wall biosynthesis